MACFFADLLAGVVKVDKQDGVDINQPPNHKMFDTANQDASDTALLARHARNQKDNMPNITINIPGLGENCGPPAGQRAAAASLIARKNIPKISLEFFATATSYPKGFMTSFLNSNFLDPTRYDF